MRFHSALATFALTSSVFLAYAADPVALQPVPRFALTSSPLEITRNTEPAKPFTVAGEIGAIFGQQSGEFEAWVFPVKILSHMKISAELAGYPVPIELNDLPGSIAVNPGRTTVTYSHAAFTVRQHMFSPRLGARGAGKTDSANINSANTNSATAGAPVIFFEIESIRPLQLTFSFTPDVQRMWPAPNFGRPNPEWIGSDSPATGGSGYYILHTDNNDFSAAVAIPGATSGILQPYQERPKTYPVQFRLAFDPTKDLNHFFPLLLATGGAKTDWSKQLADLDNDVPRLFSETQKYYEDLLDRNVVVESPDQQFNQALQWAIVSIDQLQVLHKGPTKNETGMVAGYYSSADSNRPGFGWFFGRDTLFTLYAVNSYGDFALTRRALDFLFDRQRSDGKTMHEFSQTAELTDWTHLPYFYAAADATPLLIMTVDDYMSASGDTEYLRRHWEALKLAYQFIRAHDSDGDGIYENTEGTGWVESWIPSMPHQEIYLAAMDQQATDAMARLASIIGDAGLSKAAAAHAAEVQAKLSTEYFDEATGSYAFSRNPDGSTDKTATIYPAVAWWSGRLTLPRSESMLSRWASADFSTDWGTRDVGGREKIFDPISYHQGSVWPLFTGWASLAEFRSGRTLSGTAHLMQNLQMTYAQDLGAVTELLSGEFFQPMGRSSSHQLWSSAMVLTPALRGLFGITPDAATNTLVVKPHLPASWDHVRLRHITLGTFQLDLDIVRKNGKVMVQATGGGSGPVCLAPDLGSIKGKCSKSAAQFTMPLPGAEVELRQPLPAPGAATHQVKVVDEQRTDRSLTLTLEGPGGIEQHFYIRRNRPDVAVVGASTIGTDLVAKLPAGEGLQRQVIRITW